MEQSLKDINVKYFYQGLHVRHTNDEWETATYFSAYTTSIVSLCGVSVSLCALPVRDTPSPPFHRLSWSWGLGRQADHGGGLQGAPTVDRYPAAPATTESESGGGRSLLSFCPHHHPPLVHGAALKRT